MGELGSDGTADASRCFAVIYMPSARIAEIAWRRSTTRTKHLDIDYVEDVVDRRRTRRAGNHRGLVATIILDRDIPVGGSIIMYRILPYHIDLKKQDRHE